MGLSRELEVDGERLMVSIVTSGSSVRLDRIDDGSMRIESPFPAMGPAQLLLSAVDRQNRIRRIALDARGHLLVNLDLIPSDAVLIYATGEVLDVRGLQPFGQLQVSPADRRTDDILLTETTGERDPCCTVSYRGLPIAPIGGTLCAGADRQFELESGDVLLHFTLDRPRSPAVTTPMAMAGCETRRVVAAGDEIGPRDEYRITASSAGGDPLSIVAAGNGALYVGHVTLAAGCPCRSDGQQ